MTTVPLLLTHSLMMYAFLFICTSACLLFADDLNLCRDSKMSMAASYCSLVRITWQNWDFQNCMILDVAKTTLMSISDNAIGVMFNSTFLFFVPGMLKILELRWTVLSVVAITSTTVFFSLKALCLVPRVTSCVSIALRTCSV
jgi:hypothetical protein